MEKKLRLIQVAKEFKVGLNTITDFLHKKGVTIDGSPNTQITAEVYAIVEKEFAANRPSGNERDSVREKINQKQTTVSIEEPAKAEKPKSNTIDVKSEITQPKFLGKIDLDGKKPAAKAEPKPAEAAKPEPAQVPKAEKPVEQAAEKAPEKSAPAPAAPAPEAEKPKTVEAPAAASAAPAAPAAPAAEPKKESGVFRATEAPTLAGPQILGKMDVSGMVPGGKHKRKRLDKEKVDVTRQNQ